MGKPGIGVAVCWQWLSVNAHGSAGAPGLETQVVTAHKPKARLKPFSMTPDDLRPGLLTGFRADVWGLGDQKIPPTACGPAAQTAKRLVGQRQEN